jgi:hypothetical protein
MYFPAFISSGQFCRFDMTVSYFISKRKYRADSEAIFLALDRLKQRKTETKILLPKTILPSYYFGFVADSASSFYFLESEK